MDNIYKTTLPLTIENSRLEKLGNTQLTIESVSDKNISVQYKIDVNYRSWGIDGFSIYGVTQTLNFLIELSNPLPDNDEEMHLYDCELTLDAEDFTIDECRNQEAISFNSQIRPDSIDVTLSNIETDKKTYARQKGTINSSRECFRTRIKFIKKGWSNCRIKSSRSY